MAKIIVNNRKMTKGYVGSNRVITKIYIDDTQIFEAKKTIVQWVNDNGIFLLEKSFYEGTKQDQITYTGSTPIKNPTAEYTYEFSHWEMITPPGNDVIIYAARFTAIKRSYTITYEYYSGSTLVATKTETKMYGETPTGKSIIGNYFYDNTYQYAVGSYISDSPTTVTGNATYKIGYSSRSYRTYTIYFYDNNYNVIDTQSKHYGDSVSHSNASNYSDDYYNYTFTGWYPELHAVTGNEYYYAQYTSTRKVGAFGSQAEGHFTLTRNAYDTNSAGNPYFGGTVYYDVQPDSGYTLRRFKVYDGVEWHEIGGYSASITCRGTMAVDVSCMPNSFNTYIYCYLGANTSVRIWWQDENGNSDRYLWGGATEINDSFSITSYSYNKKKIWVDFIDANGNETTKVCEFTPVCGGQLDIWTKGSKIVCFASASSDDYGFNEGNTSGSSSYAKVFNKSNNKYAFTRAICMFAFKGFTSFKIGINAANHQYNMGDNAKMHASKINTHLSTMPDYIWSDEVQATKEAYNSPVITSEPSESESDFKMVNYTGLSSNQAYFIEVAHTRNGRGWGEDEGYVWLPDIYL